MKHCRTCGRELFIKQTKRTPQQLLKPYYYTAYYYCTHCKKLYHSEEFKVINKNYDLSPRGELVPTEFDVEIWTDGACTANGAANAKASWAFVSGDYEASGLVDGKQTNNRGEALAIYHALSWAGEKGYKRVRLHSDSQITLHGVAKRPEKVKENRDIFERIAHVVKENNLQIEYQKVLGHSGDTNNERADRLATSLLQASV